MNTLAKIFYVGQMAVAALLTLGALAQTIRGLFNGTPAFVNIMFAIMTYTTYTLMYKTSRQEYKEYKNRNKKSAER